MPLSELALVVLIARPIQSGRQLHMVPRHPYPGITEQSIIAMVTVLCLLPVQSPAR